ncbi:carbohydrate ABC transporter permease [Paenibacillus koleovorans]|uniref:carbohydrate ABC transporter permease n=1 Tax=Paenibacillus koleovorans TaxID=121608 RepID=UPI0013E3C9EF|nr:carbohydrate ABC transporter permease [Paenibacillus koleovorans]
MDIRTGKTTLFDLVVYAVLLLVSVVFVYPFVYIVAASLSDPVKVFNDPLLLYPKGFSLESYEILLGFRAIWIGYANSVIYTVVGTALSTTVTLLAAHSLARRDLAGRNVIVFIIVLTMFFNGGMIPLFLVVKSLGLLDTRWAMIVPTMMTTWNLLIAKSYLETNVPGELRDAAEVDGASETTFFVKIVLPLSKPIIAVIALFYCASQWNAYFSALIYLRDRSLYPLQVFLREILILEQTSEMMGAISDNRAMYALTLKYAIMVIAVAPLLIVFPFVQRFFVKGVLIGALKE